MKLIPKIRDTDIEPGSIKIWADKGSLEMIERAVAKANLITEVNASNLASVVVTGKELHKLLGQVESSRKDAKRQFLDANKAIDTLATKISTGISTQYKRVTSLLAHWNDAEERRKEAEARVKREAEEAALAKARAEAEAKERERQELVKKQVNANTFEEVHQASMDLQFFDAEIPTDIGDQLTAIEIPALDLPKAPIPGAITTKRRKFVLTDPVAAYQYNRSLVRFEISILTAQDIVRVLEDQGLEIKIPGVEITEFTDVTTPSGRP